MENEVIILRKDLVERVELAISSSRQTEAPKLESRIDNLETLLKETIEQNKALSSSLDKVNAALDNTTGTGGSCSNLDPRVLANQILNHEKVDTITRSLSDLRSDIAKTATNDSM